jgi:cytochrome c peroxidase
VWGPGSCPAAEDWPADLDDDCADGVAPSLDSELETAVAEAYGRVGLSVAAFEASGAVNAFSSVFDTGQMSALALEGEKLFGSKGKCAQCHDSKGGQPLFTDFQYHNLGVPRNPDNPVYGYGSTEFDPGLGGFTGSSAHTGKFKTPTVRNVAEGSHRTYMHNGSLGSLRQVVQFYNTRDVLPVCGPEQMNDAADLPEWGPDGAYGCWPPPEYPENLDTKRMGDLALTDHEVDALVAFMEAQTDQ